MSEQASVRRISILIPVFNEEPTLLTLLERLLEVPFSVEREIVIVDDGSTDGSRSILQGYLHRPEFKIIFQQINGGKASAIQTALEHASGDVMVIQDADLEYDPRDLPALLAPIINGQADVVYGSRFRGQLQGMTWRHYWGNRFLTWLTNRLYGVRLTDMETCYKMARASLFEGMRIESQRFELEPEITAKLLRQGKRILELPISFQGRGRSEGKKISWRDGFGAVRTLWKYRPTSPLGRAAVESAPGAGS